MGLVERSYILGNPIYPFLYLYAKWQVEKTSQVLVCQQGLCKLALHPLWTYPLIFAKH